MDDSAGQAVGEYEARIDKAGRPHPPSRENSMALPNSGNRDDGSHLNTLDQITGRNKSRSLHSLDSGSRNASSERPHRYTVQRRPSAAIGGIPDDNDDYNLLPSRWWFAASAFPMVAGTLGPVASAFSICALVRPWRQEILPGLTIETAVFINDPVWLTVINAVQLVIAIIANMFLLLNMARRIRFSIAQPITMVGWYFSSLTLIALTATASGPLQDGVDPSKHLVWSQAFYYAIYSAVLYMIVASLMVVTFLGAWTDHYAKDFQLSNSQRTLMLQTIMFLMYLLIGALIFSNLEGWAFLDAVYWADVTLFTVGFGDFAAKTTAGRALLFPYAFVGVISLGLVIGSIRSLALERGKRRLDARMTEKNRRKFLNRMAKRGKDGILQPIRDADGGSEEGDRDGVDDYSQYGRNATGLTEYERRQEEFNIMRKIQHQAARKRRWIAMATSGGTWIALWVVGAWIFQVSENPYQGWNYFDGFYLAFVSLTTIGYGDMTPQSNAGKSFFVFWSLLALPTMTVLISNAGDTIVKGISDATNAIGRITILPGERGLKKDLKEVARAITCGALFEDVDIEEEPPGLLGAAQPTANEREESEAEQEAADEEEAEEIVNETEKEIGTDMASDEAEMTAGSGSGSGSGSKENSGSGANSGKETTDIADFSEKKASSPNVSSQSNTSPQQSASPASPSSPNPQRRDSAATQSSNQTSTTTGGRGPRRSQSASTLSSQPGGGKSRGRKAAGSSSNSQMGYALGSVSTVSVPRSDLPQELPATRAEYHCLLADEIAHVTAHLRHTPPRKYTFQEWAWFLKLIGEDERNADMHRKAQPHLRKKGHSDTGNNGDADMNPDGEDPSHLQWSWVGARSPLMGSQEEAEWILDKLTRRLQAELRALRDKSYDHEQQRRQQQEESQDPNPYGHSSHLNRRETHPIEEEPETHPPEEEH